MLICGLTFIRVLDSKIIEEGLGKLERNSFIEVGLQGRNVNMYNRIRTFIEVQGLFFKVVYLTGFDIIMQMMK